MAKSREERLAVKKRYRDAHKAEIAAYNKQHHKVWYAENKSRRQAYHKQWYLEHAAEHSAKAKARHAADPSIRQAYYAKNKDRIIKYINERMNKDSCARLAHYLRTRLRGALKRQSKVGSFVQDLGCSISELKTWIEHQFQPGMSWDNHGEWHLDHVVPLASFDLTDREQFLKACHFTNLQPLWAADNESKGCRLQ